MTTMADLSRRFDGAIPQRLKDIVIHGSALKADTAEMETLVAHYTEQVAFHKRAANGWRASGWALATNPQRAYRLKRASNNDTYAAEAQAVLSKLERQLAIMRIKAKVTS